MYHDKVILGFAEELVPLVRNGSKTLTYRLGNKYDFLHAGDTLFVEDSSTHLLLAEAEIVSVLKTTFIDLPLDRKGHETYDSKNQQRKVFEGFYKRPVLDDDPVLIIEFRILRLL